MPALALVAACLSASCRGGGTANTQPAPAASGAATPAATAAAVTDVEFVKDAFRRMAEGDPAAEAMLDWETLNMPGGDVAAEYNETPEGERAEFRTRFLKGFSESFKASGASVENAANWREEARAPDHTQVAADTPTGNTLVFTVVRRDGRQKISELVARETK